jgi:hypothetical protein
VKKLYTIWVVYETVAYPNVVPVNIKETEKRVQVLTNDYAVGYRTYLYLDDDPELRHRTPKSAINYWHKQNARKIAELQREIEELKRLDHMEPVITK